MPNILGSLKAAQDYTKIPEDRRGIAIFREEFNKSPVSSRLKLEALHLSSSKALRQSAAKYTEAFNFAYLPWRKDLNEFLSKIDSLNETSSVDKKGLKFRSWKANQNLSYGELLRSGELFLSVAENSSDTNLNDKAVFLQALEKALRKPIYAYVKEDFLLSLATNNNFQDINSQNKLREMSLDYFKNNLTATAYSFPNATQATLLDRFDLRKNLVPKVLDTLLTDTIHLNSQIPSLDFIEQYGSNEQKQARDKYLKFILDSYAVELTSPKPTLRSTERLMHYNADKFTAYFSKQNPEIKEAWENLLETRLNHMEKISPEKFQPKDPKQVSETLMVPNLTPNLEKLYTEQVLKSIRNSK